MPTQKIVYFTAGANVTAAEKLDIDAINALAEPAYSLNVANATVLPNLGKDLDLDPVLMDCDFVAGTIPTDYAELPVFDPDSPPAPVLPQDQAIVTEGDVLAVDGGTVTLSVADNVVTATFTPDAG